MSPVPTERKADTTRREHSGPLSRTSRKQFFVYVCVFCGFLVVGLVYAGTWNRDVVDPSAAGYSNYVEARGFPLPWLVTEDLPELDLQVHDRVLVWAVALDFLFFVLFVALPWLVVAHIVRRVRRPAERKLGEFMQGTRW